MRRARGRTRARGTEARELTRRIRALTVADGDAAAHRCAATALVGAVARDLVGGRARRRCVAAERRHRGRMRAAHARARAIDRAAREVVGVAAATAARAVTASAARAAATARSGALMGIDRTVVRRATTGQKREHEANTRAAAHWPASVPDWPARGTREALATPGERRASSARLVHSERKSVRTEHFARDVFEVRERRSEIDERMFVLAAHEHVPGLASAHAAARVVDQPVVRLATARERHALGAARALHPVNRAVRELRRLAVVARAEELVLPPAHAVRDREQRAVVVRQAELAGALGVEDRVEAARRAQLDYIAELLERADEAVERGAHGRHVRIDVDRDRRDIGAREQQREVRILLVREEVRIAAELRRGGARIERALAGEDERDLVAR